ncbi:MAG: site-2 protease family protein [Bryobacteraceae bacterium]
MNPEQFADLPLWYVAFLLSLTCHEAAHALVAQWGGDLTAYYSGQVTLNPVPHIRREPFGTVVVPLLTFVLGGWMLGWGSAPYDPFWEARHPRSAARMALAGPVANFILVIVAAALIHLGLATGAFAVPSGVGFSHLVDPTGGPVAEGAAKFLGILFSLNLLLGTFNLLPVSPLDGHSVVGLFLPESTFLRWLEFIRQPMPSLIGILIAWNMFDQIFWPIFTVAVGLLHWGQGFR